MWNTRLHALRAKKKKTVILPAGKEKMTFILDNTDYVEKAQQLTRDTISYGLLHNGPATRLEKISKTLKKLYEEEE